jgi:hypothetical protein
MKNSGILYKLPDPVNFNYRGLPGLISWIHGNISTNGIFFVEINI